MPAKKTASAPAPAAKFSAELEQEHGQDVLVLRLPLDPNPAPSSSGKTRLAYKTGRFLDLGLRTSAGDPLKVSANVTVPGA